MKTSLLVLPLISLTLLSCERDENFPKASTSGGSTTAPSATNALVLTPTDWHFFVGNVSDQGNPNNYQKTFVSSSSGTTSPVGGTGLTGVSAKSSSYTLGMAASAIADTASFCSWGYGLYPPRGLRVGQSLTLKARVKLMNVQGPGVSLVLRGDKGTKTAVLFSSTQGKIPIRGTADFAEYSVTLSYGQAVDWCILYVVLLPNTTGTVSVTDVALSIT